MEYVVDPIQVVQAIDVTGLLRGTGLSEPMPPSAEDVEYIDIDPDPPCAGACIAAITI